MRKTAYLLTLTVVLITALAASTVIATTSPPATFGISSFLATMAYGPPRGIYPDGVTLTTTTDAMMTPQTAIRGAPKPSQGPTTIMAKTFPMVPSTISSMQSATTDDKLTIGQSPPALEAGTDTAATTTTSTKICAITPATSRGAPATSLLLQSVTDQAKITGVTTSGTASAVCSDYSYTARPADVHQATRLGAALPEIVACGSFTLTEMVCPSSCSTRPILS